MPDQDPAEPDDLVRRLTRELGELIGTELNGAYLAEQLAVLELPAAAGQEIRDLVSADTERILTDTNTEIAGLREATVRLAEHEAGRPVQVVQQAYSSVTSGTRAARSGLPPHPAERSLGRGCLLSAAGYLAGFLGLGYLALWLLGTDRTTGGVWLLAGIVVVALIGMGLGSERVSRVRRIAESFALDERWWTRAGIAVIGTGVVASIAMAFPVAAATSVWVAVPYAVLAAGLAVLSGSVLTITPTPPVPAASARTAGPAAPVVPESASQAGTSQAGADQAGAGWDRVRRTLGEAVEDAERSWRQAAADGVRRRLRLAVNTVGDTWHFRIRLTDPRMPGLERLHDLDFVVTSGWTDGFQRAVGSMNGGALGVAGPRGAGKSTVLEAHRNGRYLEPGRQHLAFVVQAPVEYLARDFALHMYAQLCEEVRRFARRRLPEGLISRGVGLRLAGLCLLGLTIAGVAAWVLWPPRTEPVWLVALAPALASVLLAAAGLWRYRRSKVTHAALLRLDRQARRRLVRIRFLQTTTSGWSGKISLPWMRSEASRAMSRQLAGQPLTYPEVVAEFRGFLGDVVRHLSRYDEYARSPVCIGIDELDKIDSTQGAQRFVNEVKALFGVEGCNFVVSVSEDAMAAFERRGIPLRDAFDSAFDDIVRIDHLSAPDSLRLLQERVSGVPDSFLYLCHCLTGGLPRDLLRTTRRLVAYGARADDPSLAEVARYLVADDLARMCHAARVGLHRGGLEPYTSAVLQRLEDLRRLTLTPDALDGTALRDQLEVLAATGGGEPMPARLRQLRAEALCYLYFCWTVLDFFDDELTRDKLRDATTGPAPSIGLLASARQLLAVNTQLSWNTTGAFRAAWDLPVVDQP